MLMDSKNCLIKANKDKLVVIKGLEDFIVIDEADVLMIYPKSKEQEVKQVTQAVEKQFHSKFS
jgi:mannose-1-phosphate guanylyltransferase